MTETVAAHCSDTDARACSPWKPGSRRPHGLEHQVAAVVAHAWQQFRAGNPAAAERALGELLEKEVFMVSPSRSAAMWWMRLVLVGSMAGMVFLMVRMWRQSSAQMVIGRSLKPVAVSEAEIRAALAQLDGPTNQQSLPSALCHSWPTAGSVAADESLYRRSSRETPDAIRQVLPPCRSSGHTTPANVPAAGRCRLERRVPQRLADG